MEWNLTAVSLLIPLLFLLIGLAVFVVIDPYISRKHRWVMGIMLGLSASLSARNIWKDYLSADPLRWGLRTICSTRWRRSVGCAARTRRRRTPPC